MGAISRDHRILVELLVYDRRKGRGRREAQSRGISGFSERPSTSRMLGAIFEKDIYGDFVLTPVRVLVFDPCQTGQPERLTVASVELDFCSYQAFQSLYDSRHVRAAKPRSREQG